MKKIISLFALLLLGISGFSQSISYPDYEKKADRDVHIKSVNTTDYYTQINFLYRNTKDDGHFIFLNPPRHKDAYYIRANGKIYKLLSTQSIANSDRTSLASPNEVVEFSARFERLPSYTTQFDLIEGASGSWSFYGVKLQKDETSSVSAQKFRRDYNYVTFYDSDTKTWGEWKQGDNTFVININEKGDIAHLKANGETVIYKKMSGVEEGYTDEGNHHYQIIKALDEDGNVFRFQIFDDSKVGLKMMWGDFMIQFANF